MGEAFGFYTDNLVTRGHLDAGLADLEKGLERRFSAIYLRFASVERLHLMTLHRPLLG